MPETLHIISKSRLNLKFHTKYIATVNRASADGAYTNHSQAGRQADTQLKHKLEYQQTAANTTKVTLTKETKQTNGKHITTNQRTQHYNATQTCLSSTLSHQKT